MSTELPLHGRGTSANPANRFERLRYEPDPDLPPDERPAPATQFFRDDTRTIIATNDSPDVGFEASLNPYRGCEHGCVYCMSGDTLILMGDGTTRALASLRVGDEIYGTRKGPHYRYYQRTRVLAHWAVNKPAYRIQLRDGTCLIAGGDHRFYTERGWKFVSGSGSGPNIRPHLTSNNRLLGTGKFASDPEHDAEYRRGYLCGMVRGDGLLGHYVYDGKRRLREAQYHFRLALVDEEGLKRSASFLWEWGIGTHYFLFQKETPTQKGLFGIRTNVRAHVETIKNTILRCPSTPTDSWRKGFLAGIFDAEGGYRDGAIRISNTDTTIIRQITRALERFGVTFVLEVQGAERAKPVHVVRVCGGLREHLRFFHTVDPAISRKRNIEGQALKSSADLRVQMVEPLGICQTLFDITTGTGDFIANGVVSHNCYARPYHEYLGLSAGLDFETRIFVKEDAPELLRHELAAKKWQPKPLGLCGVTDAYQPVERQLQLTRRCLEVLADFRNPVFVVTKNHLVARDTDLLARLARHNAAAVFMSLTTLDRGLHAVMEPRASQPQGRLAAITALRQAGVPVGVMTAPVIPGLNDHELPALLDAAAAAGAQFACYTLLRLPYAVAELFEQWLTQHFPDKKDRVLGRIRELRGGKLNDSTFGARMRGEGVLADAIGQLFHLARQRAGLARGGWALSTAAFRRPGPVQGNLFDELPS
jgi:DNA repair photolyase